MVLLVLDAQKQITNGKLYQFEDFVSALKQLIRTARENGVELVYVRHDDGPGAELTKGAAGFEIHEDFAPGPDEKVFDKTVNSAFRNTGLLEYLKTKGETEIMMAGLQTDFCFDASVKCGFEHGFRVIIPAGANTTTDNAFMTGENSYRYYNEFMWNGRYAECVSLDEALDRLSK